MGFFAKKDIGLKGLHNSNSYRMTKFKTGMMNYFEKCKTNLSCNYEKLFLKNVKSKVTEAIDMVLPESYPNQIQTVPDTYTVLVRR